MIQRNRDSATGVARMPLMLLAVLAQFAAVQPAFAQRAADAVPKKAEGGDPVALAGGGGLVVGGVEVDATGRNDIDARMNGWRQAQRLAWPALWARLSGQPASSAPAMTDSALDGMVSAIEVEREQIGGGRYIARLALVFDRARAAAYLGRFAALASSPPFLVIPVLQDAGTRLGHEAHSPWLAAWTRLRAGESPIDYIRIQPTPGDVVMLSAWSSERRDVRFWRMLVDRYAVADVLIPELLLERSFAGGPVTALLIVRFGPMGREIGRVRVSHAGGDVNALMDEAVRRADSYYIAALRAGKLLPDPKLVEEDLATAVPEDAPEIGGLLADGAAGLLRIRAQSPDDASLVAIERLLRSIPGVVQARTDSYVLGGESTIELTTSLSLDALRAAIEAQGFRLETGANGPVVRRRAAGEAPAAAPAAVPAAPPAGNGG